MERFEYVLVKVLFHKKTGERKEFPTRVKHVMARDKEDAARTIKAKHKISTIKGDNEHEKRKFYFLEDLIKAAETAKKEAEAIKKAQIGPEGKEGIVEDFEVIELEEI